MTDLLTRLKDATEDEGYLIKCALREAHAQGWITDKKFKTAMHWAAVGAFVDAALTLVPEGWRYLMDKRPYAESRPDGYRAEVYRQGSPETPETHWGPTMPLAICTAAYQAQQSTKAEVA